MQPPFLRVVLARWTLVTKIISGVLRYAGKCFLWYRESCSEPKVDSPMQVDDDHYYCGC